VVASAGFHPTKIGIAPTVATPPSRSRASFDGDFRPSIKNGVRARQDELTAFRFYLYDD
jgi:hypothetical protein